MKQRQTNNSHCSQHIAWLAAGTLVGIALAGAFHVYSVGTAGLLITVALFYIALRQAGLRATILSLAAGLTLGLWRGSVEQVALTDYRPFYGRAVSVRGLVSDDVSYGRSGDQRIQLSSVSVNNKPLHGKIWVSSDGRHDIQRSDTVSINGTLDPGFGNMPASMRRAHILTIERPRPGDVALHIRDWFARGIHKAIPDPQASLSIGYLVGQKSNLPPALDEQIKIVGLTHAVVASGYNLTILVGFARKSLQRVSKYTATLAGLLMVGAFMLVTGLSPSMTRAGLVTTLSLATWYYGRAINPLVLLPFAAALTALLNPAYVWGDIGWFLSFASFAGVLMLAPLIKQYFWGDSEPNTVQGILIETTSAQLATLPIILFSFGQYASYALIANMLVLPLIPLTMALTFVAGVISVSLPHFAAWAGWPARLILDYMTGVIAWVAKLPGAQGTIHLNVYMLAASYAAIVAFGFFLRSKTGYSFGYNKVMSGGAS